MRKAWIVAAALALSGCASYDATLNTWVGESADSLVTAWGPPVSEYKLVDGARVMQYARSEYTTFPATGNLVNINCTTRIVVGSDNIIKSWSYDGNNCR